jgi:chromosome segregation and condensation protein ScpB
VATLGACLAAVREATLAELAQATGVAIPEVRLALRRLAEQLAPAGMQVLDDGSHVQLAPERRFHDAVAQLVEPERLSRLTQEQAEVLAIVIMDGMASRRRIEEVRGAAQLSIGPEGPVSLPRDSSETLALLLSRGLLCAKRDDHSTGRPLVYRPTPRLLQLLGGGDPRGGDGWAEGICLRHGAERPRDQAHCRIASWVEWATNEDTSGSCEASQVAMVRRRERSSCREPW